MYKCLLFYLTWTEPRALSQFRTMETVHTYIPVCAVWGPAVCLVALTQWEPLSFDRCFGARARRGAVRGPEHTDAWNKRCATAPLNKHPQQFLPNAASLSADFLSRRVQRCIRAELLNTWKFKCPCLDWNLFWVKWFTVLHFNFQLSHQSSSFPPNGHGFCGVSWATARHTLRHRLYYHGWRWAGTLLITHGLDSQPHITHRSSKQTVSSVPTFFPAWSLQSVIVFTLTQCYEDEGRWRSVNDELKGVRIPRNQFDREGKKHLFIIIFFFYGSVLTTEPLLIPLVVFSVFICIIITTFEYVLNVNVYYQLFILLIELSIHAPVASPALGDTLTADVAEQ